MATTILLHGGRLRLVDKRNDSYFQRLTRDLNDGDIVLQVGFACRDAVKRQIVFDREREFILNQTNKKLNVVEADYDNFESQLELAKSIHITGGESPYLIEDIKKYPNFIKIIQDKVVGGSSAGACIFSALYWYGEEDRMCNGLGTLPIALFVHKGSEEFNATEEKMINFKKHIGNFELVALEECEWIEKTID